MKMKNLLICTAYKGVFFGQLPEDADLTAKTLTNIKNCRMAIRWGAEHGVLQLAHTGPTTKSKIGSPADIEVLHDITAVFAVTDEAAQKWTSL